jgi:UDP-glucose 4-epimerase
MGDAMNVLITGGTGVNGAAVARLLVAERIRPVLLDNRADISLIRDIRNHVELVEGDVLSSELLAQVVKNYRVTHLAHLAALMPEPAEANPRLAVRVGVEGTVNVLETARSCGIRRVVFTSSKAAYGEFWGKFGPPDFAAVTEEHPRNPADLYGVIKVCCEDLGSYYRMRYGTEFVALRFSTIYGPGKEARHGAYSFYGQLIEKAMSGDEVRLAEGGDQLNDTVYVGDVAKAILCALRAEGLKQWVFNIGSGKGSTPREFARILKDIFPESKLEIGPGQSSLGRTKQSYCIFDIAAAKAQLGYEPLYDVESGVRDYVETIRRLRG